MTDEQREALWEIRRKCTGAAIDGIWILQILNILLREDKPNDTRPTG